jgi:feruloyl esterase
MLELLAIAQLSSSLTATSCEALAALDLENTRIATARLVPAGVFQPPNAGPQSPARVRRMDPLPEHCRVEMVLSPTPDSHINVELWLPVAGWNGKFLAVGNGGWAGSIQGYGDMQAALIRGYATAATDTGHSAADGPAGMFALGHPEKIVDFAFRAVHDMAVKSKRVIAAYYRPPLEYAYFKGCSTGGRQAVMAAQRYPGDFDGIIAGALANRHIHMHTVGANRQIELARHPERALSAEKAAFVNESVMAQCDTLGEGFLNNPRECPFDVGTLACSANHAGSVCLDDDELATVREYYDGVRFADGELIFSGQALGNPIQATTPSTEGPGAFVFDTIRILGFQDADYDWRQFDLERDMPRIDDAVGWVDATNPDLRAFEAQGGKLLLYAGWGDTVITPENTILYYESVLDEMGAAQDDWMRLFLVPGMGHCGGGPGPNTFDSISALEQWREHGVAPEVIEAENPQTGLTRPLCPYPEYARYTGVGAVSDGSFWECAAP